MSMNDDQNAQVQQPYQKKKSSLPLILGIIVGGAVLMLVCCGGMAFFGGKAAMDLMNAPVEATIAAMEADADISGKLGTPIESTSAVGVQNYQNNNNNGSADVQFNAKGPNGTASVKGSLTLTAGTWSIDNATVTCPDGDTFELPK